MRLQPPARLHFVGIGGAGMSSLARFAHEAGYTITGSDQRPVDPTRIGEGVEISRRHDPSNIEGAAAVIVSSAIPEHNVERSAALAQGVPLLKRGELLARFVAEHPHGVAVCGTHGKGTTAGALVAMLEAAGRRVSYVLGAPIKETGLAAVYVRDADVLVAEVDESDRTHLAHRPRHLLINNLEVDHLHTYADLDALVRDFTALLCERFTSAPVDDDDMGAAIVGLYGAGIAPLQTSARSAGIALTTCGVEGEVDGEVSLSGALSVLDDGRLRVELRRAGEHLGALESPLKGALNARNLVTAAAMALALGAPFEAVQRGSARYQGLTDRFDEFTASGRVLITDYTSHPTSIEGNLRALRARRVGTIHAVFQPFRYTLLEHFWGAYIDALALADHVHILQMDGAGEAEVEGIDCARLTDAIRARDVRATRYPDLPALRRGLIEGVAPGEALIVFGGGPLFPMTRALPDHW